MTEQVLSPAWAMRRDKLSRHIEEASMRCILEHGFDRVTVQDIATEAGISRRSFYRYFPAPGAVLAALPRRSLDRLVNAFAMRPLEEGITSAFLKSFGEIDFSPEENAIRELSAEILKRWPDQWRSAIGGLQADSIDRYQEVISQRLRALNRDASHAGALAATFSAVIVQVNRENLQGNPLSRGNIPKYRAAFHAISDLLRED